MKKGRAAMLWSRKKIRNRAVSLLVSAAMVGGTLLSAVPAVPVFAAEAGQEAENPEAIADRLEDAVEGLAQSIEGMAEAQPQAEAAGERDLTRYELFGAEDGNIARSAKAEAVYSNPYSGDGTKVNDGAFANGNGGTVWNTWNTEYGTADNPVWVQYTWDEPHVIESARVMWWIYTDTGVRWPRSAFMQYKKGDEWVNCGEIATDGNSANYKGEGGAAANKPWPAPSPWGTNTVWNPLVLEEKIVTTQLRLCVVAEKDSGTVPGIGVSEWEVFGYVDPAMADLASIDKDFLMELYADAELPTTGANGSAITWSNSTNPALTTEGKVTRPSLCLP